MSDLDTIRARAAKHQEEIEERTEWFTPAELAARWKVCQTTVRDIPPSELPYRTFGRGIKKQRRRYSPAAVEAFEAGRTRRAA